MRQSIAAVHLVSHFSWVLTIEFLACMLGEAVFSACAIFALAALFGALLPL